MSFYDHLGESGFMKEQQFSQDDDYQRNHLEDSMNGSQQFIDFRDNINQGRANNYDNYQPKRDSSPMQTFGIDKTPDHLQPLNNYSRDNQILEMTSENKPSNKQMNGNYRQEPKHQMRGQKERDEVQFEDDDGQEQQYQQQFNREYRMPPQQTYSQSQQFMDLPSDCKQSKINNDQLQNLLNLFDKQPGFESQNNQPSYLNQYSQKQQMQYQKESFNGPALNLNQDNSLLAIAQRRDNGNPSTTNSGDLLRNADSSQENEMGFNSYMNNNNDSQIMRPKESNNHNMQRMNSYGEAHSVKNQVIQKRLLYSEQENIDQNIQQVSTKEERVEMLKRTRTQQPTNFQNRQHSESDRPKQESPEKFDNIPIKTLNRRNKEELADGGDEVQQDPQVLNLDNLSIMERLDSLNWKVRQAAFKELNKELLAQFKKDQESRKNNMGYQMEGEKDEFGEYIHYNAFELYGPKMEQIISDSNLIVQYEGLQCLMTFMSFVPEVKETVFQVHTALLDKVQVNKPNFKEITLQILLKILQRDPQTLIPALLKRFKNKNIRVAVFVMQVIFDYLKKAQSYDASLLRQIFKALEDNLPNSNKEIRDSAIGVLKQIYSLCEDDPTTFIKNIKAQLRPVQIKELKDLLSQEDKSSSVSLIQLFQPQQQQKDEHNEIEDEVPEKCALVKKGGENMEFDLALLVPQNFFEIPYLTQINVKKKGMEAFNQELEKIINRREHVTIANKDYTNIFNVVTHLLEDSNMLVFSEAIKAVENLTLIFGKSMKQAKLKHFIQLLTEKYKESKTVVVSQINKTLAVIVQSECFQLPQLIEYLILTLAFPNKNPRVKQLILEKVDSILQKEYIKEDDALALFKLIKDKLTHFLQKETNDRVRDAAIAILINFKRIFPNIQIVNDTVNALPKYRITEINKKALEQQVAINMNQQQAQKDQELKDQQKTLQVNQKHNKQQYTFERTSQEQVQEQPRRELVTQSSDVIAKGLDKKNVLVSFNQQDTYTNSYQQQNDNRDQDINFDQQSVQQKPQLNIVQKSKTQEVVEMIDQDFEVGMQMIKALTTGPEIVEFKNKELLCQKLIQKIETSTKNSQQQYFQAYSLKALLWLKSEIFGIEDSFKLLPLILDSFCRAQSGQDGDDQRDSSVELYLINNWTKELSLRDIIDRIAQVTKKAETENEKQGIRVFTLCFRWILNQRLQAASEEDKWSIEDLRKISIYLAKNIKIIEVRDFIQQCVDLFGIKRVREFMEIQLMHAQVEYNMFIDWFNIKYRQQDENESKEFKLPQINVKNVDESFKDQKPAPYQGRKQLEDLELNQALQVNSNFQDDNSQHSVPTSARNQQQSNGIHSKLYQQMRQKRKTSNQRKNQTEESATEYSSNKYENIIQRLEEQLHTNINPPIKSQKQQQSFQNEELYKGYSSSGNDQYSSVITNTKRLNNVQTNQSQATKSDKRFRYEEQKLDTDANGCSDGDQSMSQSKVDQSNNYYGMNKFDQYKRSEEIIKPKQNAFVEEQEVIEDAEQKLMQSVVKESKYKEDLEYLEYQKKRLDEEKALLMREKNQESAEWRNKYEQMKVEHEEIVDSLQEANKCYLVQVDENEDLRKQLKQMNDQHLMMLKRFEEIELKIQQKDAPSKQKNKERDVMEDSLAIVKQYSPKIKNKERTDVVKEESLQKIEDIFNSRQSNGQLMKRMPSDGEQCIKKIQELLLNSDSKENNQDLGQSLFFYYSKIRSSQEKLDMIRSLNSSLESEDILYALSVDTYIVLIKFLLRAFSIEKAKIERESIQVSMSKGCMNEQNEITVEVQKIISKLLNSKEFTTSLVSLFQVLKEALPEDMGIELNDMDKQFLRVLMRCVSRISKALHSENPDLVRSFDVLIEMQKIFAKHPPESLREDMPSLQEFDFVYRTLKDVSDKLMDLQPHKVKVFLDFVSGNGKDGEASSNPLGNRNAFIVYMKQVIRGKLGDDQMDHEREYNDDDEEGDHYNDYDGYDDHNK